MAGVYRIHQDHEKAYFQKPGLPLHDPPILPQPRKKKGVPRVRPKVAPPNPKNISPKIGIGSILRTFGKSPWFEAIKPSVVADATRDYGPYYWQESGFERKPADMIAPQPQTQVYENFQPA